MNDFHSSESTAIKAALPFLVRLGVAVAVIGLAFPIYGIPLLDGFKLTFFRMGLLILVPFALSENPRLLVPTRNSALILRIFILLAAWRLLSLLRMAVSRPYGPQSVYGTQLIWYAEGIVFLLSMLLIYHRFRKVLDFYLRALFFAGCASFGVMAVQFLLSRVGILWTLPLSTSAFGQSQSLIAEFGYPLMNGRVVGAFADPNMSGTMCALFFATFFPLVMYEISARSNKRWLPVVAILVLLIAVVGTGSRQAFLAILMSFCMGLFFLKKRRILVAIIRLVPILILSALIFNIGKKYFTPGLETAATGSLHTVFDRLVDKETGNWTGGDMIGPRLNFIKATIPDITFETFFIGMGEGMTLVNPKGANENAMGSIHNAYLITLLETGLFGLLILLFLSFVLLYLPYKALRREIGGSRAANIAVFCISFSWVFLIFTNWAQLNQSISFLYLALALLWLNHQSTSPLAESGGELSLSKRYSQ